MKPATEKNLNSKSKHGCPKKSNDDKCKETEVMVCLSNLEEIVFYTHSSRCLLTELSGKKNTKTQTVDYYDKYLDYFE